MVRMLVGTGAAGAVTVMMLATTSAPAAIHRHDVPRERFEEHARQIAFRATGQVLFQDSLQSSTPAQRGSATLIAPRWAITAGHVVEENRPGFQFVLGDRTLAIDSVVLHPGFFTAVAPYTFDLALVRLASPVDGWSATLDADAPTTGWLGHQVGFGDLTGGRQRSVGPNVKNAGTNAVDGAGVGLVQGRPLPLPVFSTDFDEPGDSTASTMGSAEPSALEVTTSGGDSGGGLYREIDGAWRLAGVTVSRDLRHLVARMRQGKQGRYGIVGHYVAVSPQLGWICAVIAHENASCRALDR